MYLTLAESFYSFIILQPTVKIVKLNLNHTGSCLKFSCKRVSGAKIPLCSHIHCADKTQNKDTR